MKISGRTHELSVGLSLTFSVLNCLESAMSEWSIVLR